MKSAFKKSLAVFLAALMLFGAGQSLALGSITAAAETSDGLLSIATKIFRQDESGEWIDAERIAKGEYVKARAYVGTDYYTNSGELMFFYDSEFFTDDYVRDTINEDVTVNPELAELYGLEAQLVVCSDDSRIVTRLIQNGIIEQDFMDTHVCVAVLYSFSINTPNMILDASEWLVEFDLKVLADTQKESGEFFALASTVQSTANPYGYISVPWGRADEYAEDTIILADKDVDVEIESYPVVTTSTVVFDANGGSINYGTDDYIYEVTGNIGDEIVDIPDSEREGYIFAGWSRDEFSEQPEGVIATFGYEDVYYFAVWEPTACVISFSTECEIEVQPINALYHQEVELPKPAERTGYTFECWVDENGNEVESPLVVESEQVSLTARWNPNAYQIEFDANGGEYVEPVTADFGDAIILEKPEREGHVFVGWRAPDGKLYLALQEFIVPAENVTLSAVWMVESHNVTYYVGSEKFVFSVACGSEVPTPDLSDIQNAEFLCWLDSNGKETEIPDVMPDNGLTFTAKLRYHCGGNKYGVTASYESGCFDYEGDDIRFVVEEVTGRREPGGVYFKGENYKQTALYNIKFYHGDEQIQPRNGKVEISIPVPVAYNNSVNFLVIHRFSSGAGYEELSATKKGGMLVFSTDSFSDFEIYVKSETVIKTKPAKLSYNYKEALDLSGLTLETVDENGSKTVISDTSKMTVKGYDPKKIGTQTVTVEYDGTSVQFNVTVSYAWWQMLIRILLLGFLWY